MQSRIFFLLTLFALSTQAVSADPLGTSVTLDYRTSATLESFDYKGVTLDGGGMAAQYELVKSEYLAIPNDALLKSYREMAGLPAPGAYMGGWYDNTRIFNIFGQVLSGLARFYAGSGDPLVKAKADYLIAEWAKCIRTDGFFYNTPNGTQHYDYEKMVGGLVDNYIYCGNQQALECLGRITDWALAHLNQIHRGSNSEWYTLGENLYRAYQATGQTKYLDYARVWEYTAYWERFDNDSDLPDLFTNPPVENGTEVGFHAYSHVNTFSSAAAAYEVTGNRRYQKIITNAFDYLWKHQEYATGGYGPMEALMDQAGFVSSVDAFSSL